MVVGRITLPLSLNVYHHLIHFLLKNNKYLEIEEWNQSVSWLGWRLLRSVSAAHWKLTGSYKRQPLFLLLILHIPAPAFQIAIITLQPFALQRCSIQAASDLMRRHTEPLGNIKTAFECRPRFSEPPCSGFQIFHGSPIWVIINPFSRFAFLTDAHHHQILRR
jgi:hypothetical protein